MKISQRKKKIVFFISTPFNLVFGAYISWGGGNCCLTKLKKKKKKKNATDFTITLVANCITALSH